MGQDTIPQPAPEVAMIAKDERDALAAYVAELLASLKEYVALEDANCLAAGTTYKPHPRGERARAAIYRATHHNHAAAQGVKSS